MDSFLAIAEELNLRGLKGSNNENELNEIELQREPLPIKPKQEYKINEMVSVTRAATNECKSTVLTEQRVRKNNALSKPLSCDLGQLDETVKSLMDPSQSVFANGSR